MAAPLGSTSPRSPHAGLWRKPRPRVGSALALGAAPGLSPFGPPARARGGAGPGRPARRVCALPGAEGCGRPAPDRTNDEQRVRLGNGQKRASHGATASARPVAKGVQSVQPREPRGQLPRGRRYRQGAPRAAPPPAARPAPDIRPGPASRLAAIWRCARRRAAGLLWPGRGCCSSETPSPRYRRSVLTWRVPRAPTAAPCPAERAAGRAAPHRAPVLPSAPRLARPPPRTPLPPRGLPGRLSAPGPGSARGRLQPPAAAASSAPSGPPAAVPFLVAPAFEMPGWVARDLHGRSVEPVFRAGGGAGSRPRRASECQSASSLLCVRFRDSRRPGPRRGRLALTLESVFWGPRSVFRAQLPCGGAWVPC